MFEMLFVPALLLSTALTLAIFLLAQEFRVAHRVREAGAKQQSERDLVDMRAFYSGILGSATDAIITIDADDRILFFNKAASEMFDLPIEEAMGSRLDRLDPRTLSRRARRSCEEFRL